MQSVYGNNYGRMSNGLGFWAISAAASAKKPPASTSGGSWLSRVGSYFDQAVDWGAQFVGNVANSLTPSAQAYAEQFMREQLRVAPSGGIGLPAIQRMLAMPTPAPAQAAPSPTIVVQPQPQAAPSAGAIDPKIWIIGGAAIVAALMLSR